MLAMIGLATLIGFGFFAVFVVYRWFMVLISWHGGMGLTDGVPYGFLAASAALVTQLITH